MVGPLIAGWVFGFNTVTTTLLVVAEQLCSSALLLPRIGRGRPEPEERGGRGHNGEPGEDRQRQVGRSTRGAAGAVGAGAGPAQPARAAVSAHDAVITEVVSCRVSRESRGLLPDNYR